MNTNMHERATPSYAKPTTPFRYPPRKNAPPGFDAVSQKYNPPDTRAKEIAKKPPEFTLDALPNGKFRVTLSEGKISSTISFNASEDDIACIQQELAGYIRDESPTLEACTIFLMAHLSQANVRRVLTGTLEGETTSKYESQGRSAMYLHEAYEGGREDARDSKGGRPRQDAHKLKIDVRPGSDIPTLVHAGFTRFDEIRAATASAAALQS